MYAPSPSHLKPKYDWHRDSPLLGQRVSYEPEGKPTVQGICTGCQFTGSVIENLTTGENWPGIRFRIRPDDGSRQFWTRTFPDRRVALTDEILDLADAG